MKSGLFLSYVKFVSVLRGYEDIVTIPAFSGVYNLISVLAVSYIILYTRSILEILGLI
jgi:hypothetical protein